MHEPEEGEQCSRSRKGCCFIELAVDHEHTDGSEHETTDDGAATEDRQPFVEHAHPLELVQADGRCVRARSSERAVDLHFTPCRHVRRQREYDGWRMPPRRPWNRLGPN